MNKSMKHNGMSLIELLVVVSISALLIGILLPSLSNARQQAMRSMCLSNLRQMVTAAQTYSINNDSFYPIAYESKQNNGTLKFQAWDFNTWKDWSQSEPVEQVLHPSVCLRIFRIHSMPIRVFPIGCLLHVKL